MPIQPDLVPCQVFPDIYIYIYIYHFSDLEAEPMMVVRQLVHEEPLPGYVSVYGLVTATAMGHTG